MTRKTCRGVLAVVVMLVAVVTVSALRGCGPRADDAPPGEPLPAVRASVESDPDTLTVAGSAAREKPSSRGRGHRPSRRREPSTRSPLDEVVSQGD